MEGTMHILANGGLLPQYQPPPEGKKPSAKRKGVKQGVLIILLGALLVPVFGVMSAFAPGRMENFFAFWAALTAILAVLIFITHRANIVRLIKGVEPRIGAK